MNLADGYEAKLSSLTGDLLQVDSAAILRAAKNGSYQKSFTGQNTGINTASLTDKKWTGPALVCQVPARIDGIHGTLTIGIK